MNTIYNAPAFRYFIKAIYAHAVIPLTIYADNDAQAIAKAKSVAAKAHACVIVKSIHVNAA